MIQKEGENLKKGDCFVLSTIDYYKEGVIINNSISYYDVLWCTFDKTTNRYKFHIEKSISEYIMSTFNKAVVPHFCKFENLYSVLQKYQGSMNDLIFLGALEYDLISSMTANILYFKGEKTYFEVMTPLYKNSNCNDYYVYINEVSKIEYFKLSDGKGQSYLIPKSYTDISIRKRHVFDEYEGKTFSLEVSVCYSGIEIRNVDVIYSMIIDVDEGEDEKDNQFKGARLSYSDYLEASDSEDFMEKMKVVELFRRDANIFK